ncbi:MAG: hypothetical protein H0V97_09890 [Actinobacteria bacterium]|nr:hypothetical protein [Actinomycetota bacterium]
MHPSPSSGLPASTATPIAQSLGVPLDRAGRVQVMPNLTIPERSGVFVIGDLAAFEQDGQLVPGIGPAAIQEARHAAGNITRVVEGKLYVPFRYRDKGMLAVIGRAAAVANLRHLKLSGFIAWLTWVIVQPLP